MSDLDPADDNLREGGWLADYRRAVEKLRGETVAEFGGQPMPPEALSAIAVALTSLPLVAMMLPTVPVEPTMWEVGLALLAVWLGAFRIQSVRYGRFQRHWRQKVAAFAAAASAPGAEDLRFLR
jgi:hypothetical protein